MPWSCQHKEMNQLLQYVGSILFEGSQQTLFNWSQCPQAGLMQLLAGFLNKAEGMRECYFEKARNFFLTSGDWESQV